MKPSRHLNLLNRTYYETDNNMIGGIVNKTDIGQLIKQFIAYVEGI